jgi:hypothetical protein
MNNDKGERIMKKALLVRMERLTDSGYDDH